MKFTKFALLIILICGYHLGMAQINPNQGNTLNGWANSSGNKVMIGGYAGIHYNQPLSSDVRENGKLDVHRMVMLFGYKFDKKTSFYTEIEYEHVKEVYIEQAFFNYKINNYINLRGGLLLVPMGIINEYHEPTTFYGVERPILDNVIVPTTWREIGAGFSGNIQEVSIRYQLYLINGFLGYDGSAKIRGSDGFRKGRQKGAESIISSPNVAGKISYYGLRGLNLGASIFAGKTESTLYSGLDKSDDFARAQADSSTVNLTMLGLDARYDLKAFHIRGQFNFANVGNAEAYNAFTGSDIGNTLFGYYIETGYNVFKHTKSKTKLIPFVRYEKFNTHASVAGDLPKNDAYNRTVITTGIDWKLTDGLALKVDYQFFKNAADTQWNNQLNLGIGVWFR